jgi:hypothetical protein
MAPVKRVMRVAAWLLAAASLSAQGLPSAAPGAKEGRTDFSGRWTLAPEPAGPATARSTPGMGTGWGPEISIAQDAKALTIEFATYARGDMQPPTRLVYLLDGSPSTNTINSGRGPQEQAATAAWNGSRLTIATVRTFSDRPGGKPARLETTQVLALEAPGTLVVETTHGAALGGRPATSRAVYKKN